MVILNSNINQVILSFLFVLFFIPESFAQDNVDSLFIESNRVKIKYVGFFNKNGFSIWLSSNSEALMDRICQEPQFMSFVLTDTLGNEAGRWQSSRWDNISGRKLNMRKKSIGDTKLKRIRNESDKIKIRFFFKRKYKSKYFGVNHRYRINKGIYEIRIIYAYPGYDKVESQRVCLSFK